MIAKFIFIWFVYFTCSYAQLLGPRAALKVLEYDFGNIEYGKIVTYNFTIANTGGDILIIKDVRASCGCTAAKPQKSELKPGESTAIEVMFNSNGRSGQQQKYVFVNTNDPNNSEIKLKISGNIINPSSSVSNKSPKLFLPETQYDFGSVAEGKIVSHTFKIVNKGKATLDIKDIKTSCGCTAALVSNKQISPGKEGTLKIDLDTKNRQGKLSRAITITSNDPDEPNKVITIYADINRVVN
jgi:hypothetical protein